MSLLAETRARLQAAGLAPQHRFGQNFMIDASAIQALVVGAGDSPRRIVEVGPGTGLLSEALLAAGHEVLAVELDHGLARLLHERFIGQAAFHLAEGDALPRKSDLHPAILEWSQQPWALVANLPYEISIPLILNCLQLPRPPDAIVVTVQYEAAQRLCSQPGQDAWGASAAVVAAAGQGEIVRRLPPGCFWPRPRVDSAVWCLQPSRPVPPDFGQWCRRLFAYRRKVARRGLRDAGCPRERIPELCAAAGVDPEARIETLSVSQLVALQAHSKEMV